MTIAMMIDIETLSLRPDAYVTQVGYCVADLDRGVHLQPPSDLPVNSTGQDHRHKDFDTIRWWTQQDPEVAKNVFGLADAQRMTPTDVLYAIRSAVTRFDVEEVWASPAMFDLPILTSLWGGVKPWKYSQERCLKTLASRLDPERKLAPPPNEMLHDAVADAQWQMEYLIRLHPHIQQYDPQMSLPLEVTHE